MANKNKKNQVKNQRCLCCKEIGHTAADCPRDPNFKTFELIDEEVFRIAKITENKKLFPETAVTTTHFLKRCIKIPKKNIDEAVSNALIQANVPGKDKVNSKKLVKENSKRFLNFSQPILKRSVSMKSGMSGSHKIGYESEHHINNNPFQRGVMSFEDYNYNQFNKYILIDEKGRTVETKSSNSSIPPVVIPDKKEMDMHS